MVHNATFNNISVIQWLSVFWWRKPPTCRKSLTDCITYYCDTPRVHLAMGVRNHNFNGDWNWLHNR